VGGGLGDEDGVVDLDDAVDSLGMQAASSGGLGRGGAAHRGATGRVRGTRRVHRGAVGLGGREGGRGSPPGAPQAGTGWARRVHEAGLGYLIHFFLEICHCFLEILRTFTGIFLRLLRSEYSFSVGRTFLS
jgi:hypothetical protein